MDSKRLRQIDEQPGKQEADDQHDSDVRNRLSNLLRDESHRCTHTDASAQLRKRACPSGE
jgi:hypothetical protein